MFIKTDRWLRGDDIPASEITPQHIFEQRRRFLAAAAMGAAGATLAPWASREALAANGANPPLAKLAGKPNPAYTTVEKATPYDQVTTYNNFYEFGTDKSDPARYAGTLRPHPWQVSVEGLVKTPKTYDLDDLMKLAPMEERIYRLRCVEGWSMVIPWVGFPLAELIKRVEPQGSAKFIQSSRWPTNARCPASAARCSSGRTAKACAWTRRCTRWRYSPLASTVRCCRTRTARRCA